MIGIGAALLRTPPTPPDMRVRIRRFASWKQTCPKSPQGFHEVQWNAVQGWLRDVRRIGASCEGRRRARAVLLLRSLLVAGGRFYVFHRIRVHQWFFLVKKRSALRVFIGGEGSLLRPLLTYARTNRITPVAPPFRPSLTHGYACRSPRIRVVNFRCTSASSTVESVGNGFVVLRPLASGSLLASTTFLFVTSQLWLRLPPHGLSPRRSCLRLVLAS